MKRKVHMKQIVLLTLIVLAACVVYAVKHLPWWLSLAGAVALFFVGKVLLKRWFLRLLVTPFKMKGAVLNNAVAEVHSLSPFTDALEIEGGSEDAGETEAGGPPRQRYQLEVTVRPAEQGGGPFVHWEPGELRLVRPESVLNPDRPDEGDDNDDSCLILRLWVEDEGEFKRDEGFKFQGPLRLRMVLGVKPGVRSLKFRYYFEEFGGVQLPEASANKEAA